MRRPVPVACDHNGTTLRLLDRVAVFADSRYQGEVVRLWRAHGGLTFASVQNDSPHVDCDADVFALQSTELVLIGRDGERVGDGFSCAADSARDGSYAFDAEAGW